MTIKVEEIKVKMFRVSDDSGKYYDCVTPLDNYGVIIMVTDENGDRVKEVNWDKLEELIKPHL